MFVVALVLSMLGLSFAVKTLPTGTAYAVWVGIGAALTVIYGMVTGLSLQLRPAFCSSLASSAASSASNSSTAQLIKQLHFHYSTFTPSLSTLR